MKLDKIPHFSTPEEEDEFWQTHSPLDFEHEPVEPQERTFRYPTMANLTIRLDESTRHQLETAAQGKGVRPTALARNLIRKGLRAKAGTTNRHSAA